MFYGRFESGNLNRVVKKAPRDEVKTFSGLTISDLDRTKLQEAIDHFDYEYDLYLEKDTNSDGLMHWFYYKVITKNLEPGTKIKMNIRNLHRTRSLYQQGMLPRICYANQDQVDQGKQGWHVDPLVTYNVKFFTTNQNDNFDFEWIKRERTYHTMSFIYQI